VRASPFDCEREIERLKGKMGKLEDKFTLSFFIIAILIMIIFLIIR